MTKKEFARKIMRGKEDLLQVLSNVLNKKKIPFCVIGGLAVNAYAEPVVSLDLDIVVQNERLPELLDALGKKFYIKKFAKSIDFSTSASDLRVQIQLDARYQGFISRAKKKDILGYKLPVASIEDVMQGKVWAAGDESRRPSKRQKDLADILRLVEQKKGLIALIPPELKSRIL